MNGASHKIFGYHGSYLHPYDGWDNEARKNIPGFIETWNSGGFRKSNNAYGPGLYFVLDLNNARTGNQTQTGKGDYGNFIYKFELDVANYFIADQDLILRFKSNASENYSKNIIDQLKIFGVKDFAGLSFDDPKMVEELIEEDFFSKIRSDLLVQKLSEKLSKASDGAIFYTPDFGYMGVAYNLNSAQLKGYINRNELESEPEEKDYESSGASVLPKLSKLISALRKSGFKKEASDIQQILRGPIDQKDWEEAAEEFGADPISEDQYANQVIRPVNFELSLSGTRQITSPEMKQALEILKQKGVSVIPSGEADSFNRGFKGHAFHAVYKGKPCILKLSVSNNKKDLGSDVNVWREIQKKRQSMPPEISKHFPAVYFLESDSFSLPESSRSYFFEAILMEELKPLPNELRFSMVNGTATAYDLLEFISDLTSCANEFISENFDLPTISEELIKLKLQNSRDASSNLYRTLKTKNLTGDIQLEVAKIIVSYLEKSYPQVFLSSERFTPELRQSFQKKILETFSKYNSKSFPLDHDRDNENVIVTNKLNGVLNALRWLKNVSENDAVKILWKDIHAGNVMIGADGEIKITDVGEFKIQKKVQALMLSFLLKQANPQSIQTLGFPHIAAKLFSETLRDSYGQSVADKWDFVFAKFYLDDMGLSSFSDYKPSYVETHLATSVAALIIAKKLLFASDKDKEDIKLEPFYRDFRNYTDRKGWGPQFFFEDTPETQFRPSTSSYSKLSSLIEELEEEIKHALKIRCENDFHKDLFANKVLPNTQAKSKTKAEVLKMWMDKVPRQAEVIFSIPTEDGEWRWIDVGRNSDWVRNIFKNCGNVSWEGLRATSESKKHAKMLALLDPMDVARAMVTWNPKYTEDYGKNPEMKKYLGGLEAPGSSILKPEYHKYFYDLVAALQPDIVNISNQAVAGRDAEGNSYVISNEPIRNTLREKGYKLHH